MNAAQAEQLRHAVREFLAVRFPTAHTPRAILRTVAKEVDFAPGEPEISMACEFLIGLGQVKKEHDPLGSTLYFTATTEGVRSHEKGELMARIGKIARLPETIREELNRRLRSGTLGPQLLPWLNALPEVRAVLEEFFQNKDINSQNLSDWRTGGYEEWERKQDNHYQRIERTRELAQMSMKLAQAGGGNLTDGASAIVAGEILGVLEELEQFKSGIATELTTEESAPDKFQVAAAAIESLALSISRLRKGDQNKEVLRQRDEQLRQKDEELKLAKAAFDQRLKEYQDKVAAQKSEIESALGVVKAGGLTPETLQRIEEAARLL